MQHNCAAKVDEIVKALYDYAAMENMTNNEIILSLRGSKRLDDCQLVTRYDRMMRLASVENCLNEKGLKQLANLREVVLPELQAGASAGREGELTKWRRN